MSSGLPLGPPPLRSAYGTRQWLDWFTRINDLIGDVYNLAGDSNLIIDADGDSYIGNNGDDTICFYVGGVEIACFTADGLIPSTDEVSDLGSATQRWDVAYVKTVGDSTNDLTLIGKTVSNPTLTDFSISIQGETQADDDPAPIIDIETTGTWVTSSGTLGMFRFFGPDNNGTRREYAKIEAVAATGSPSTYDGQLDFWIKRDSAYLSTNRPQLRLNNGTVSVNRRMAVGITPGSTFNPDSFNDDMVVYGPPSDDTRLKVVCMDGGFTNGNAIIETRCLTGGNPLVRWVSDSGSWSSPSVSQDWFMGINEGNDKLMIGFDTGLISDYLVAFTEDASANEDHMMSLKGTLYFDNRARSGTENFEIVDGGTTGATEQKWIEVTFYDSNDTPTTGYIRVYATK